MEPHGIALDDDGNVYNSDYWHQYIEVNRRDGTFVARWGVGRGSDPGTLNFPGGIEVDDTRGYLYIANREEHLIERWRLSDGVSFGRFFVPGGPAGVKGWPRDVAVNEQTGDFYIADEKNQQVDVMAANGSLLQTITTYGSSDKRLGIVQSVAVNESGELYVADLTNKMIHVYNPSGAWTRSFGIDRPNGVEVRNGVVYVLSWRVSEYTTAGTLIQRWGSTGTGDNQLNQPYVGIAVDETGKIYIGDSKNHRVKVFNP